MALIKQISFKREKRNLNVFDQRQNCSHKWKQSTNNVLGSLEVPSEPDFLLEAEYMKHFTKGNEDAFDYCIEVWDEWNLKDELIKACETIPKITACCGLLKNDDATIKNLVPLLNRGWVRAINHRLLRENKGFKIDCFVWTYHNAIGKTESNIFLIRFKEYSPSVVNLPKIIERTGTDGCSNITKQSSWQRNNSSGNGSSLSFSVKDSTLQEEKKETFQSARDDDSEISSTA